MVVTDFRLGDKCPELKNIQVVPTQDLATNDLNVVANIYYINGPSLVFEGTLQLPGMPSINLTVSGRINEISGKVTPKKCQNFQKRES